MKGWECEERSSTFNCGKSTRSCRSFNNILPNLHSNTHLRRSPPSLSHLLHCHQIPDLCCLKCLAMSFPSHSLARKIWHHQLRVLPDLIDPNTLVVWAPKTEVELRTHKMRRQEEMIGIETQICCKPLVFSFSYIFVSTFLKIKKSGHQHQFFFDK